MEGWLFLDQFILTDDDSSSDEDERVLNKRPRIQNYLEEVVDKFSDFEFRENFRMNRVTFNFILDKIENKISAIDVQVGRNTIPAKKQLLLALWYFATPDSYRSICQRFDVAKSTGLAIVRRVCMALIDLAPTVIRWPTGEYLEKVKRGFRDKGFENTIGCIDGSYIPIPMPKEEGRAYICRKNFPCLTLQAVCDHEMLFTHCYAGESGAVHDSNVLKRSEIWTYITDRHEDFFPNDTHLLGDKAYPISPQLMTPFKNNNNLTPNQINFNTRLCSVRNVIERAFGLLKKRFRILKFMDVRCLRWSPRYIIACCVLHNICIMQNDIIEVGNEELEEHDAVEINDLGPNYERRLREEGMLKRHRLANNM